MLRILLSFNAVARRLVLPSLTAIATGALAACAESAAAPSSPVPVPGAPSGPVVPTPNPSRGMVTGTVRDGAGRPIAGAEVVAANVLYNTLYRVDTTDADGRYAIDTREPIGTWRVSAQAQRSFEGRNYRIDLHPDSTRAFAGVDGATRDFTWRLFGARPDGGFYGVRAYLYANPSADNTVSLPQHEIEVTFTPVGPLADGSVGVGGTVRLEGTQVNNIPLGRYLISARHVPADNRTPRPLGIRLRDTGAYTESLTASWEVAADGRPQALELEVRPR